MDTRVTVENLRPPLPIRADAHKMEQVLVNLVLNAVVAMPTGGRLVFRHVMDEHFLTLIVSDTGEGIPEETMNGEGKRVLIVEDDPGLRFTMTDALEGNGFAVTGADNGDEAIRRLLDEAFDVVVTDLRLPGKDGMEVLRAARGKIPPPSVVVLTG